MAFDFSDVDIERMKSALQNDRVKVVWCLPVPTTQTATFNHQVAPPTPPPKAAPSIFQQLSSITSYTHTVLCLAGTACGVGVSLSSITFIAVLLLTRWLAPGTIHFAQPVYFDYSKPTVQGHTDLGTPTTPYVARTMLVVRFRVTCPPTPR